MEGDQMFYKIKDFLEEISDPFIVSDFLTIGFLQYPQLEECYDRFGFDYETLSVCHSNTTTFQNAAMIYADYSFCVLHILDTQNIFFKHDKIALYVKKNLFLVIDLFDTDHSTKDSFDLLIKRIDQTPSMVLEEIIVSFLTSFLVHDNKSLELLDLDIENLEKCVLDEKLEHFDVIRQTIFSYRRKLLILRNYYEQYLNITEDFIENSNRIFCPDNEGYFLQFENRVRRLSDTVRMLSDYLSQVKESYQAQLDINLNQIMKIFTIVTTIFMPLSLIVGWYGMNFKNMPELSSPYGYPSVIVVSLIVSIGCILWFRRKHFM